MSGSVNRVTLVGNLGADPEVRRTQAGDPIVNLRIATSETWRDRQSGERKERTEWSQVVIFNENLAKVAEQYARKGSKVYVEGQLQTRKWTDQNGQERYSTEIVLQKFRGEFQLLDKVGSNDDREREAIERTNRQEPEGSYGAQSGLDDSDTIPFMMEWR